MDSHTRDKEDYLIYSIYKETKGEQWEIAETRFKWKCRPISKGMFQKYDNIAIFLYSIYSLSFVEYDKL